MKNRKILNQKRRSRKLRASAARLRKTRLCIHRSHQHIYANVISADNQILAQASTLDPEIKKDVTYGGNVLAAKAVGKLVAERAKKVGVKQLVFDRSGYKYHGRIKALAEAAREGGIDF